jgi:hypothetical protein
VQLLIGGAQLDLFLACILLMVLLGYLLGALGRYGQGYDRGYADAERPPRPCRRCRAAQLADTQATRALDMDLLEAALEIVERQQEQLWAGDPVLRGRLLELEITQMADAADRKTGWIR